MIQIQVVPRTGHDAYKLLRSRVLHQAATWYFSNKKKTRLRHIQSEGHIDIGNADGVLTARVFPKEPRDVFYLAEKFMGRIIAWFGEEVAAVNLQFVADPPVVRQRRGVKKR